MNLIKEGDWVKVIKEIPVYLMKVGTRIQVVEVSVADEEVIGYECNVEPYYKQGPEVLYFRVNEVEKVS